MSLSSKFFIFGLALLLVFLSISSIIFVSPIFFFDQLIYQKSSNFGYLKNGNDWSSEKRMQDLYALTRDASSSAQVLGAQDSSYQFLIGIFGDSWGFGEGVRETEIFPVLLEQKLNKSFPNKNIKVLNFSFPGDNLYDHYKKIQLVKEKAVPLNLSIIQVLDNDFIFNRHSFMAENWEEEAIAQEILTSECTGKEQLFTIQTEEEIKALGNRASDISVEIEKKSFNKETANYCLMSNLIQRFSPEIIIFYPEAYRWHEESQVMLDLMQQRFHRMMSLLGTGDSFQNNFKEQLTQLVYPQKHDFTISMHEGHPNASYHQFIADRLYDYIIQTPEWQEYLAQQKTQQ